MVLDLAVRRRSSSAPRLLSRLAVPHPADCDARRWRAAVARHAPARAVHDRARTRAGTHGPHRPVGARGDDHLLSLPGAEVERPAGYLSSWARLPAGGVFSAAEGFF